MTLPSPPKYGHWLKGAPDNGGLHAWLEQARTLINAGGLDSTQLAALQSTLDQYEAGVDATDLTVSALVKDPTDTRDAVLTTAESLEGINVLARGAVGGVDSAVALQASVDEAVSTGRPLVIPRHPGGAFRSSAAIVVNGSLTVVGDGSVELTGGASTGNSPLFSLAGSHPTASFSMRGVRFAGTDPYRAVDLPAGAVRRSVSIVDVESEAQAINLVGSITGHVEVRDIYLGRAVTASRTARNPYFNLSPDGTPPATVSVSNVTVQQGVDASFDVFKFSRMYQATQVTLDRLTAIDLSPDTGNVRDGFDLDGVGSFARISNILCVGGLFEYKSGTSYGSARDAVMTNLVSLNAKSQAFSFRSSGSVSNAVAIGPNGGAFYCTGFNATDATTEDANLRLSNITALSTGKPNFRGLRIAHPVRVDGYVCKPAPGVSTTIEGPILVDGSVSDIVIRDAVVQSAGMSTVTSSSVVGRILLDGCRFDTPGVAQSVNALGSIGELVVRDCKMTGYTSRPVATTASLLDFTTDDVDGAYLAYSSSNRPAALRINGVMVYYLGAGTQPPMNGNSAPGSIVVMQDDNSVWVRTSASGSFSAAWRKFTTTTP